jgi:uncharacterized protein (TIGR02271 family)
MSDARDTNHDGKVSLMEKVKDKLHPHKNAAHTTTHTSSTTHHNSAAGTALPAGAIPIIANVPVVAAVPVGGHDSRDLNRDGHVSTSERLMTESRTTGAHDSRDLNRDGHISTSEKLMSGSMSGAHDSRDLNRDGHVSTSEKLMAGSSHSSGAHMGAAHMSEEARLRLHEEQLAISKREVGAGEVNIQKHVHEQHVQQTIPVRREEVIVERRPLSGIADPNARIAEHDETMRVALFREEIVTEKRIVPTEEVIVRKKEVVDQQTVGATLRSEHVETVQTGMHTSAAMGAYDARDTNRDGHVSMGEKLHGASGMSSTGAFDARDTNRDGHVSMGEKLKGASGTSTGALDARDTNRDGHVSMGEKLKGASGAGALDSRDTNKDGHVSMGEKLQGAARG